MNKEVNLDEVKTFYDPHPGLAGAMVRIPEKVRQVAQELDGQPLSLREAVNKIRAVTNGEVSVVPEYKYIRLLIRAGGLYHSYRVIQYK